MAALRAASLLGRPIHCHPSHDGGWHGSLQSPTHYDICLYTYVLIWHSSFSLSLFRCIYTYILIFPKIRGIPLKSEKKVSFFTSTSRSRFWMLLCLFFPFFKAIPLDLGLFSLLKTIPLYLGLFSAFSRKIDLPKVSEKWMGAFLFPLSSVYPCDYCPGEGLSIIGLALIPWPAANFSW